MWRSLASNVILLMVSVILVSDVPVDEETVLLTLTGLSVVIL